MFVIYINKLSSKIMNKKRNDFVANPIESVKKIPNPKNPKNIKQFLGLAGYYKRFIDAF